jgi:hypothetical protein
MENLMKSIAKALNNIAISLSKIADAIRAKATVSSYQPNSITTTSTATDYNVKINQFIDPISPPNPPFPKDIWYTSTEQQKMFPNSQEKDLLAKKFQKHKHFPPMENDAISQKIKELGRQDDRDKLIARLRNTVINDNGLSPLSVNSKYHDQIMTKHRKEWPSLWAIIDDLVKIGQNHDVK